MGASIVEIADAMVDVLNGASLSQSFTAVRTYIPIYGETLMDLRVWVVPHGLTLEMISRRDDDFAWVVDVAVQERFESPTLTTAAKPLTDSAIDARMQLAEEILDLFRGKALAFGAYDSRSTTCMSAENTPIYLPDHLDERNVFTSVLSFTFKETRAR